MQENLLGTFNVIRGFADLRDLAEVSISMPYQGAKNSTGTGYQRIHDDNHVEDIKRFLSKGRNRFFPEIVLSLRSAGPKDPVVRYVKRRTSPNDKAYWVGVNLKELRAEGGSRIRRIDGNHRLEAAVQLLKEDDSFASIQSHRLAPFCFVVLDSDKPEDDELAEAMLFNLINSKAMLITSEHSLSVLMRDDGAAAERFIEDPQLYLTRWMHAKVKEWPQGFYTSMGDNPLSCLHAAACVLLRPGGISKTNQEDLEKEASQLFGPLYELAIRLRDEHETFVNSYAFLPIAAEVYTRHSMVKSAKGANTEVERRRRTERWLRDFSRWFDRVGAADLPLPVDPSILWTVFKRDFDKKAGQVFIAMSFRESKTLESIYKAIEEAIEQYNEAHPNAPLSPMRIDKQDGPSYEIPARVFNEIDQSRLVIADLTDEKQNVYCEVGYAKAKKIPFILTFQGKTEIFSGDTKSSVANKVHFDLAPYRYIEYDNPLDLRDKLKKELDAWIENK
ncbi:MAG: hypothetical protein HY787_00440 [Deltaproteobacteria bacterium]|nr:hypothetical protein [Deltaproteobacteria bacterium]